MSRLLNGNNIDFLIGKELAQLALGSHHFHLNFDAEVSILVESSVRISAEDGSDIEIQADDPEQTKNLVFLLAKTIEDVAPNENQDLTLLFDDGSRITLSGSNGIYEAYVIWNKGDYIAVPIPPSLTTQ